jgi:hypothetical protein
VLGGTAPREPTHQGETVESVIGEETAMSHPFLTQELVNQRRAALHAEATQARLAVQLRPGVGDDAERAWLASAAQILVRQVRAIVARAA